MNRPRVHRSSTSPAAEPSRTARRSPQSSSPNSDPNPSGAAMWPGTRASSTRRTKPRPKRTTGATGDDNSGDSEYPGHRRILRRTRNVNRGARGNQHAGGHESSGRIAPGMILITHGPHDQQRQQNDPYCVRYGRAAVQHVHPRRSLRWIETDARKENNASRRETRADAGCSTRWRSPRST